MRLIQAFWADEGERFLIAQVLGIHALWRHISQCLRGQPDKPPGTAFYSSLGLPSASLGRPTRVALGKPRVQ